MSTEFWQQHWGDVASVSGLLVALIGFALTIWKSWTAATAAAEAWEAAKSARDQIHSFDLLQHLAKLLQIMEEIKRLHRLEAWAILPDRYSVARQLAIIAKKSSFEFDEEHHSSFSSLIAQLTAMETKVERVNMREIQPPSREAYNEILRRHSDELTELIADVRRILEETT